MFSVLFLDCNTIPYASANENASILKLMAMNKSVKKEDIISPI